MKCKYCHKPAGLFKTAHKECEEKNKKALNEINELFIDLFSKQSESYSSIEDKINSLCIEGFIDGNDKTRHVINCINGQLKQVTYDEYPYADEFITSLPNDIKLDITTSDTYKNYCDRRHLCAIDELNKFMRNVFTKKQEIYPQIENQVNEICSNGHLNDEHRDFHTLESIKKQLNICTDNAFVGSFIESLPQTMKDRVISSSEYSTFYSNIIRQELHALKPIDKISSDLSSKISSLKFHGNTDLYNNLNKVALDEFDRRANYVLEDGIIDNEEENALSDYIEKTGLKNTQALLSNNNYTKIIQSLILRDLQEGKKPTRFNITGLPVVIGKTESIAWVFQGVKGFEEKTGKQYISGSRGVSVRICKGVYYRVGATKGHSVSYQYKSSMGSGVLVITNKNVIFNGVKPVKIPINKIVSFTPYSDGIELIKDGANPKPYTFVGCDSWFIINAIQLLA